MLKDVEISDVCITCNNNNKIKNFYLFSIYIHLALFFCNDSLFILLFICIFQQLLLVNKNCRNLVDFQ